MARRLGDDRKLLQYADRAECDLDTFQARIRQAMAAADAVGDAMRELARSAYDAGLSVASHRSEEHTSELQSLMRISYAVFCLKKQNTGEQVTDYRTTND